MSVFSGFAKWKNNTNPINLVLEVLVRQILKNDEGLAEDEMVTPELMAQLTSVYITRRHGHIRDLGGLEHATNLESLIFIDAHTARRDLTPLAGLAHPESCGIRRSEHRT